MASKRRLRKKACEGKQRHPDRKSALIAASKTGGGLKAGLGAYQCRHCNTWHVGHATGSRFLITSALGRATLYPE